MAFDPKQHSVDEKTGYHIDTGSGQIVGMTPKAIGKKEDEGSEFPKWVKADDSHVIEVNGNKIVPLWPEFFVDRLTQEVTVLVHDAEEEAKATSHAAEEQGSGTSEDSTEN